MADRAIHDTEVRMEYGGRVGGPEVVVIPAGSAAAEFPIIIADDAFYNLPPFEDHLAVGIPGWPGASATISVKALPDRRYVLVNRAGEEFYGKSRDQIIGKTAQDIFPSKTFRR